MTLSTPLVDFVLEMSFDQNASGVFFIETSAIDGTDGLSNSSTSYAFSGSFDDITNYVVDEVTVVAGTDQLAASVQAGSLTCELLDTADLAHWNPNNPGSDFNSQTPGFVPMRPVRLRAFDDTSTAYGIFWGFLRRADWNSDTCSCEIYCEDLLLWMSRSFPTIPSTGPTTTGDAIGTILDAIGWTDPGLRQLDTGDTLTDFSSDGTTSALQLTQDLLTAERGTVYHRGDGILVYEERQTSRLRLSSWTLNSELTSQTSGIDADALYTRVSVTGPSGIPQIAENLTGEFTYGRSDAPAISSNYIPDDTAAELLAADMLYETQTGKPPIAITVDNESADVELQILTSPLLSIFTVSETLGNTSGAFMVQRVTNKIRARHHAAEYLLQARPSREFNVTTSAIDGTDVLRY